MSPMLRNESKRTQTTTDVALVREIGSAAAAAPDACDHFFHKPIILSISPFRPQHIPHPSIPHKKPSNMDYEFLVTRDRSQHLEVSDDRKIVRRIGPMTGSPRIVYLNRELDEGRNKLILRVEHVSPKSGSRSFTFGCTTCDPESIRGHQCHATSPCVRDNSCAGSSVTFDVTNCSTVSFFAHFSRCSSKGSFVSVTIGKKTFPFNDPDHVFDGRPAFPFIILDGAVDSLSIIREDELPVLAPIGQKIRTPRNKRTKSDSVSSSSSTGTAATPKSRINPSLVFHNSGRISDDSSHSPTPLTPVPRTPVASGPASNGLANSAATFTPTAILKRTPVTPVTPYPAPSSVLDARKQGFVFPKGLMGQLNGEINNRSHASTQTESRSDSGDNNSLQSCATCQSVRQSVIVSNGSVGGQTTDQKFQQQPVNAISPKTSTKWISNSSVRLKDGVISLVDQKTVGGKFIFGSSFSPNQVICFKVKTVNIGAKGSLAFGLTTKNRHVMKDLPNDPTELLLLNPESGPKTWFIAHDLLSGVSVSSNDIIVIRRINDNVSLRIGHQFANLFTIHPDVKVYPFLAFNGSVRAIELVGGDGDKESECVTDGPQVVEEEKKEKETKSRNKTTVSPIGKRTVGLSLLIFVSLIAGRYFLSRRI